VKQIDHQSEKHAIFACDGLLGSWVSTRPAAELISE
jgi:hypothetical protein